MRACSQCGLAHKVPFLEGLLSGAMAKAAQKSKKSWGSAKYEVHPRTPGIPALDKKRILEETRCRCNVRARFGNLLVYSSRPAYFPIADVRLLFALVGLPVRWMKWEQKYGPKKLEVFMEEKDVSLRN